MKIALIARIFEFGRGGLERFHVNLAFTLLNSNADVTVYSQKGADLINPALNRVQVRKGRNLLAPNSVRFADAVRKILKPSNFDCVIANTPYYPCDIHRAGGGVHKFWYQMRKEELGGIYKIYACLPRYRYALNLEKNVYDPEKVLFQIANSRLVKAQMIKQYGFPEDRIAVVYNGIDFSMFNISWCQENRERLRAEMNLSKNDFVILFPSNNFKRKGLDILIKAAIKSKIRKNILILAVGRDRWKTGDIRINFAGYQENMLPFYAISDCIILPTMYEPCSNVVLEGMACGIVSVTSPTNGASEFIDNEKNGFVMNSWNDADQLKSIIEQLYSDAVKRKEMGQNAFQSVKEYTLEKNTDQIKALCLQAMALKEKTA